MNENEILSEMRFDPARGALLYRDVRYLLVRPETLRDVQKAAEEVLGRERAGDLFFAGGRTGGLLSSRRFKEAFGLSDREAAEFMCRMGARIGWGAMLLLEFDPADRRLVVEVQGSPFAATYGPSKSGVCHLTRGVMSGLAEGLFGGSVEASETFCQSRGDACCRFEVRGT
ncbi:MAG: hypothetical protein HY720_19080 [Planctomycetes bacterium]|nr:hypothetical protein [Planctomycetota bacterium]